MLRRIAPLILLGMLSPDCSDGQDLDQSDKDPRYPYSDAQLFDRGHAIRYEGQHLEAVSFPVGGVGAGAVHLDGRGVRHAWMIFPRYWLGNDPPDKQLPTTTHTVRANQRVPLDEPKAMHWYMSYVPDSFFAIRAEQADREPVVRVLQTLAEGAFEPVDSLSMTAAYPFAWYRFKDDDLPVQVSLRAWNPLIPGELRDSSMPCAIYDVTVENPSDVPVAVTVMATQQNAAGLTGNKRTIDGIHSGNSDRNVNRLVTKPGRTTLRLETDRPRDELGHGELALAIDDTEVSATAEWYESADLHADLSEDGRLNRVEQAGPTRKRTVNGAIAKPLVLEPGERKKVTFVLAWRFPNAIHGNGVWAGSGNRYTQWWEDAEATTDEVLDRYEELSGRSQAYQEALYETNLPFWMLQRISSQVTSLRTRTVWWSADGYFGGYEGMNAGTGNCPGNCSHVWQYAQTYARLFPELARRMRQQDLADPLPDGGLRYRQASRPLPADEPPHSYPAADGQLGVVLGAYREYLTSADARWLRTHWFSIQEAMQFVIRTWDADANGELGGIQHTTLDCKVGGSTSWIGSLYLAGLRACEKMAEAVGDDSQAAEYRALHESGSAIQQKTLFNGEYYTQHFEGSPDDLPDYYTEKGFREHTHSAYIGGQNYFDGCITEQLLGQWWADQLDLGALYPPQSIRTALQSLYRHNFFPSFRDYDKPRVSWTDPDDGGMVVATWPRGTDPRLTGKKRLGYASCTLSGFEYAAAAEMIRAGLIREGFSVVKAVSERYDGRMRKGLDKTTWGYSGNPFGDDESGKWYVRSQSSWSLLLAAQGFIYHGPEGVIGFDPVWKPADHSSFFTGANGFGVFRQKRTAQSQTAAIEMRDGTLDLRRIVLHTPEDVGSPAPEVSLNGAPVASRAEVRGRRVEILLAEPTSLDAGDHLDIRLTW